MKKNQLNQIYRLKDILETRFGIESELENILVKEKKIRTGCSPDLSPETRKKADPVCFGEGSVRDGEEQRDANPRSSTAVSVSPPGVVEKPPEYTNSGEQLARLGRGKSSRRRGLRTRGGRGMCRGFYRGQGSLYDEIHRELSATINGYLCKNVSGSVRRFKAIKLGFNSLNGFNLHSSVSFVLMESRNGERI